MRGDIFELPFERLTHCRCRTQNMRGRLPREAWTEYRLRMLRMSVDLACVAVQENRRFLASDNREDREIARQPEYGRLAPEHGPCRGSRIAQQIVVALVQHHGVVFQIRVV